MRGGSVVSHAAACVFAYAVACGGTDSLGVIHVESTEGEGSGGAPVVGSLDAGDPDGFAPATGGSIAVGGSSPGTGGSEGLELGDDGYCAQFGSGGYPVSGPVIRLELPNALCRTEPLYFPSNTTLGVPSSVPTECLEPFVSQPDWAQSVCADLYCDSSPTALCPDTGLGLDEHGIVVDQRAPGDVRLLTSGWDHPLLTNPCRVFDACYVSNDVGVTWDCGTLPSGEGGDIVPGLYVLVGYIVFDPIVSPAPGTSVRHTLYLGSSSGLVHSSASPPTPNRPSYSATFTYSVQENRFLVTPVCELTPAVEVFAIPMDATFTASDSILELYDDAHRARLVFQRLL